ncbi:MAG: Tn3 family transposase [Mycobacteriales bacterium]
MPAFNTCVRGVVLWNTRYLDPIVDDLRAKDLPVRDEDVARLSPLGHAHLDCLGRYAFTAGAIDGLRPLRDPTAATTPTPRRDRPVRGSAGGSWRSLQQQVADEFDRLLER